MKITSVKQLVNFFHFLTEAAFTNPQKHPELAEEFYISPALYRELMESPFADALPCYIVFLEPGTLQDLHIDIVKNRLERQKHKKNQNTTH